MKPEFKKLDKDITEIVSDIPLNELKKIYYKQTYDSKRSLWINNEPEEFKRKERDIEKFINRMSYEQRIACIQKEAEAFNNTLYDLRVMLRSEAIEGISTIFTYIWLIGSIKEDLEGFKATGDDQWIDSAFELTNQILNPFYEKYWNDETVKDISDYLDRMEDAPELTEEDKNHLSILSDWVRIYGLYKDLKTEEKAINE